MGFRNPILVLAAAAVFMIVVVISVAVAGLYVSFSDTPVATESESPTISPLSQITVSPAAGTPSPAAMHFLIPSPRAEILNGRVIDAYATQKLVTVQLENGEEEIIEFANSVPVDLAVGDEVQFSGTWDVENGIFLAETLTPLAAGTLQFTTPLNEVKNRQKFADTLFTKAITLEFGKELSKPKPFYLVIIDPMGRIVTPFRNGIPSASYNVEGSLVTLNDALKSTQRIRIGDMALGVWTIKLVILPGADMTTIFGFDPGLAPKPLSELVGKLWYFQVAKR